MSKSGQLPQHGTGILTATYVLEDTLYSIELLYTLAATHWPLRYLVGYARYLTTLDPNGSGPGLSGYDFLVYYFGVCNPVRTDRKCRKSYTPC